MITYINGRYLPHSHASIAVDDRGYLFSDGIYEVIALKNGVLIDGIEHLDRLDYSLRELRISFPYTRAALNCIIAELQRRNRAVNDCLYIHITRGVAKRDHAFPPASTRPGIVLTFLGAKGPKESERQKGIAVISQPDIRWGRRDIKSISLLPNILAKQQAVEAKVKEAWLVTKEGLVTEGSSTNAYIVNSNGTVITHPTNHNILGGITRQRVLKLAREAQITVEERPFTLEEALNAKEAFLTSTTLGVVPIVKIDGQAIDKGEPGGVAKRLMELYDAHIVTVSSTAAA